MLTYYYFSMTIEEQIEHIHKTTKEDIDSLEPKDRLNYLDRITEYIRPKIQRTNFEPTIDKERRIKIEYEDS